MGGQIHQHFCNCDDHAERRRNPDRFLFILDAQFVFSGTNSFTPFCWLFLCAQHPLSVNGQLARRDIMSRYDLIGK